MATFPSYVGIKWTDMGETAQSIVSRTEMEKGTPKQRRIRSDVLVQVSVTLYFRTQDDASNFENWFYNNTNGGADFFTWKNPRTNSDVQARIVGGDLGTLKPGSNAWLFAERSIKIEYLKEAYT